MSNDPASVSGYAEFCLLNGLEHIAFGGSTSFGEAAAIAAVWRESDEGRYRMKILFAHNPETSLPFYFSSIGHEVWIVDPLNREGDIMRERRRYKFRIVRDTFLHWNPKRPDFRMTLFMDTLGGAVVDPNVPPMEDMSDSISIAKARSMGPGAATVFFTVPITEDPSARLFASASRRAYAVSDVKSRLLDVADRVVARGRDTVSNQAFFLVR